jgi:membrane protein YqaA with SNARE-associated domain
MKNWFDSLHAWLFKWANTKWAAWSLFLCAFADASFLPLPTPALFLTMTLLNMKSAYKYAIFATMGIFFGALVGYSVGYFAWLNSSGDFTGIARFMFDNIPGFTETVYNNIQVQFEKWDFWILFVASYMPVPFNIFSISSGVFGINIFMFCLATFIGQGSRFFLYALAIKLFGPKVKKIFEANYKPALIIATVCVIIIIILVKIL